MRKNLIMSLALVFCLGLVATPASAMLGFGFGVKAGLNISDLKSLKAIEDITDIESEAQTGFVGGAYVKLPFGPLKLQVEALYSVKGAEGHYRERGGSLATQPWETRLKYLEFPVLARYEMPTPVLKPYFYGGAGMAFLLSADQKNRVTNSDWEEVDIKDDLKTADFSLLVGVGVELMGFTVEGRYTHGLTDPLDPQDNSQILMNEAKNRTWAVMVGFDFM